VEPFPEDVARFLDDHIESIDQLEILRVLGEDREREWDSVALAGEVQAEPEAVRAHLTAMHSRGLLRTTTQGVGLSCRYGAGTPELENIVGRLLQMYRERPVTMIKMVYDDAGPRPYGPVMA
jgi:predicted ArsR family transcriptional regulator